MTATVCDCHVHVFDPGRFPYATPRTYTPGTATVAALRAMLAGIGAGRVVLVQPSVYGTDNACLIDALEQLGPDVARGIAVIDPATASDAELDRMHRAGVRGIRVNLESRREHDPAATDAAIRAAAERAAARGWALQIYADVAVIAAAKDRIAATGTPVILDHYAGAKAAAGLDQPGLAEVLDLLRGGHAYVKLSAPYRPSRLPDYDDLGPLARAFFAANPQRLIWGTDWPHTGSSGQRDPSRLDVIEPFRAIDNSRALALLRAWAPDQGAVDAVLSGNPARLFGF